MSRLLADIGGTNARFARVEIDGLSALEMSEPVVFPTWSDTIESFDHLLEHYSANRPPGTPDVDQFDALSIAIAGAVVIGYSNGFSKRSASQAPASSSSRMPRTCRNRLWSASSAFASAADRSCVSAPSGFAANTAIPATPLPGPARR